MATANLVPLARFRLTPVFLETLKPGDGFELYGSGPEDAPVTGFVWRVSQGSVEVRVYGGFKDVDLFEDDGKVRQFSARGSRDTCWSRRTMVLRNEREDVDMTDEITEPGALVPGKAKPKAPTKGKAVKKAAAPKAPKVKSNCECGCGTETGGRFAPGHDARYYGWLKKVVAGQADDIKLPDGTKPKAFFKAVPDVKTAKKLLSESKH